VILLSIFLPPYGRQDTGLSCAKETGLKNFPVPNQHYTTNFLICQEVFEIFFYY